MARDLDHLKEVLWEQFERAVARQPNYEDYNSTGSSTPTNLGILGRQSIGTLGQAIIDCEREIRERDERDERHNGLRMPGK